MAADRAGGANPKSRSLATLRTHEANRGLTALVGFSILIHGGLVGGVVYVQSLKPVARVELNAIPVEIVSAGEVRAPELLPRIQRRPPPQPPNDAVALETTPKAPKPAEKPKPKKRKRLSDAARRLLDSDTRDSALDNALERLRDEKPEGRPDGSELGTSTDPSRAATAYETEVASILRSRYQLPLTIPPSQRRFLQAELVLFIDRQGNITRYVYTKRHANQPFMSALENLLQSVKLPPPPSALVSEYAAAGLAVRFKPD